MSGQLATFDELQNALATAGVDAAFTRLVEELRSRRKYHELFEALKMRLRFQLGLPLRYNDLGDDLDETRRNRLEEGLLEACREVGACLLANGRIREGWMYLRPVGDRTQAAQALAAIKADEDNLDELVEVALHEGVDPALGYRLVLEHYGTCNAITTYETVVRRQRLADQQVAAGLLVEHVHRDLLASVRADISRQEGREPAEQTLAELVADRDWLFGEHSYHIDTTHLASTVRYARILEDPQLIRLALDLTAYGRRLSPQFQYVGDEPFVDTYPDHALYFQALLGEQVDQAVEFFRRKAEELDPGQHGTEAVEACVQLMSRLGRHQEAMDVLLRYAQTDGAQAGRVVPMLLELAKSCGNYQAVRDFCRERDDLLGFASALIEAAGEPSKSP